MIYKCKVVLVIVILHSKHNSIYQNNDDDKDVKYGPCNHPQEVESEPGSITKIVKSGVPWVLNDFIMWIDWLFIIIVHIYNYNHFLSWVDCQLIYGSHKLVDNFIDFD